MSKEPRWLSKEMALAIHERLLAEHGGAVGIRDEGLLEAALVAPKNLFLYEHVDIFGLASSYAHGITRNHPFLDGNKRVALTMAGVFLALNGYRFEASESDAVRATTALVDRKLDQAGFAAWLRAGSKKQPGSGKGRRPGRPR